MGIFSFFAEIKLNRKLQKLSAYLNSTNNTFAHCLKKRDMPGAVSFSRILLENISYSYHLMALHDQQYGPTSMFRPTTLGQYRNDVGDFTEGIIEIIQQAIIHVPEFRKTFVEQMASETSPRKQHMILLLTRITDEIGDLEGEINRATAI